MAEANTFVEGWGAIIFPTANEIIANEKMRQTFEQFAKLRAEKGMQHDRLEFPCVNMALQSSPMVPKERTCQRSPSHPSPLVPRPQARQMAPRALSTCLPCPEHLGNRHSLAHPPLVLQLQLHPPWLLSKRQMVFTLPAQVLKASPLKATTNRPDQVQLHGHLKCVDHLALRHPNLMISRSPRRRIKNGSSSHIYLPTPAYISFIPPLGPSKILFEMNHDWIGKIQVNTGTLKRNTNNDDA